MMMRACIIYTLVVSVSLCSFEVLAETIRGVNLGGWLVVEEW